MPLFSSLIISKCLINIRWKALDVSEAQCKLFLMLFSLTIHKEKPLNLQLASMKPRQCRVLLSIKASLQIIHVTNPQVEVSWLIWTNIDWLCTVMILES